MLSAGDILSLIRYAFLTHVYSQLKNISIIAYIYCIYRYIQLKFNATNNIRTHNSITYERRFRHDAIT